MGKAEQASKEKENLKKVTDKKETKKEIKSIWYELGFGVAGPIYKGLFEWIEKEALIKKIDRHKRTALVETEFMGEKRLIEVGLEIILKNK